MIKKNDECIATVIGTGMDGEGVIKVDDLTVFVPFSFLGEKIRFRVLKVDKKIAFGKVLEILTPAEERVREKCPVYKMCGGCDLSHLEYKAQLKIKENKIKTCFNKIAGIEVAVDSAVPSPDEYRYRNKLSLPVGVDKDGKTVIGFYARNSHRIVPIEDCLINPEWTKTLIAVFKEYINKFNLKGYDETTHSGDIREITAKEVNGKLIIAVVTATENFSGKEHLIEMLKTALNTEFSLYQNINKGTGNGVYGEVFKLVYGDGEYKAKMFNIKYSVGVQSFMQVNPKVCEKLYGKVKEEIFADKDTVVIDAYSGAGLMTALLSDNAKKAIGIEIVKEAVNLADKLKEENGLSDKIENHLGKCEEILPEIIERERKNGAKLSLVLDPPRKGCDINVVKAVRNSGIEKIVYVSCKPSTLARDIGLIVGTLTEKDGEIVRSENPEIKYEISKVIPMDMFPQTKHVETLCVLNKVKC